MPRTKQWEFEDHDGNLATWQIPGSKTTTGNTYILAAVSSQLLGEEDAWYLTVLSQNGDQIAQYDLNGRSQADSLVDSIEARGASLRLTGFGKFR